MSNRVSGNIAARLSRIVVIGSLLAAPAAHAALINVDFNSATSGTYVGAAVLGLAGDVWNGVIVPGGAMSNIALVDATGASTTARLSSNLAGFAFSTNESSCTLAPALACDYLVANNRTITFSVSGLTASQTYDLVLYFLPLATGRSTSFRVGSTTATATQPAILPTTFVQNVNYVRFAGTVASTGLLSFDLIGGQFSTEGDFNGFQLNVGSPAAVPEPTGITLALAGMAAAAIARRRSHGKPNPDRPEKND